MDPDVRPQGMRTVSCASCAWFQPFRSTPEHGHCRRFPPAPPRTLALTSAADVCGEWRAFRPDGTPDWTGAEAHVVNAERNLRVIARALERLLHWQRVP